MNKQNHFDTSCLPRHVAIIMDGNGRWAQQRKRPRLYGHKAGADSVRSVVEFCRQIGIGYLTLYAFSSENWQRPAEEVNGLMGILKHYLQSELSDMQKNGIRLLAIGDHSRLPEEVLQTLHSVMQKTRDNKRLTLTLALSYGGRNELVRAVRQLSRKCVDGDLTAEEIEDRHIEEALDTAVIPDPDLMIRTGGEKRLSNFLLWQLSYAEIYFTDTMWPDFRKDAFSAALASFQRRNRRFGKTSEQVTADRKK